LSTITSEETLLLTASYLTVSYVSLHYHR